MARLLLLIPLVALAMSFLGAAHFYIAKRLVLDLDLSPVVERVGLVALVAVASTLILQPAGERLLRRPYSRVIAWPASIWMGVGFLLLFALAACDLVVWGVGLDGGVEVRRAQAGLVALVVGVASIVGLRNAMKPPVLKRVEIGLPQWPASLDGFRIVQISDIHIGPILDRRFARQLVDRVNELEADLVAVTGDLVDGSVRLLEDEVAPFAKLRARFGVFFVTGNHDHYSDATQWVDHIRKLGMTVLRNAWVKIGVEPQAGFALAGVDDHHARMIPGESGEDLERALGDIPPGLPIVLLAHDPATFKKACGHDVTLQLSGHTHDGQIWPFKYFVRLAVPFVAGLYERSGSQLYVSRGTGFWGPPMRLAAPAEITELVLRSPESDAAA